MAERLTKAAARNIFYGGSIFFFVVFVILVGDSVRQASSMAESHPISDSAALGKRVDLLRDLRVLLNIALVSVKKLL